ncbi:PAS domain-containing protein [Motilibacter sp. E257]|uniref:histidine kinase n=1 Tax=Motilibacter deserti TaxID=2714956 RepID=A0ABX0GRB8_9ACTN|nr:PAS domain-containing protein [Motilibacter deserti]
MPTLTDLARERTALDEADLDHLQALIADWQLLADLSFADLVLWVPYSDASAYVAVAQMRPTTGPTLLVDDVVGDVLPRGCRTQVDTAYDEGRICRERDPEWRADVPVREETVPVMRGGRVIGVITRHTNLATARTPSRLELTYLRCANDLARMIAEGCFPLGGEGDGASSPRVGDGLLRLDPDGYVTYASPNALSAYRRLGVTADLVGAHLGRATAALAPHQEPVDEALESVVGGRSHRWGEVAVNGTVVLLRAIPLLARGTRVGALVLVREVSELRRREQELLSKDATIREIHHRVKNNLQTVAALLRLQARRVQAEEARAALNEAVSRVGSIAVVHETLSRSADGQVAFDEVAGRLASGVVEVATAGAPVRLRRTGEFGVLPAEVATPLALVLTELLANAVEHGCGPRGGGDVEMAARRRGASLRVTVQDNGPGLPEGFSLDASANLGLRIVTGLVRTELGGTLTMAPGEGGGTVATVDVSVPVSPAGVDGSTP